MNRYISFLDILGFGDLVRNNDLQDVIGRMKIALRSVEFAKTLGDWQKEGIKNEKTFRFFSFSDTFIFVSEDDSPESFFKVLVGTTLLTQFLFGQRLPVRGSITKGEADYIPDTDHLVGKGILRAYELEKYQDWFGVIVDPAIITKEIHSIVNWLLVKPLVVEYDVPVKSEVGFERLLAINWRFNLSSEHGIERLLPAPKEPAHETKVNNTLRFCKYLRDNDLAWGSAMSKDGKKIDVPWLRGLHAGPNPPDKAGHHGDYGG